MNKPTGSRQLVVGTYTESLAHVDGKADGILAAQLDGATLDATTTLAEVRNPSWVARRPMRAIRRRERSPC
jgi:6-phosphogluconolactonase